MWDPRDTTHAGPASHLLGGGRGREGGYEASKPFIMFSSKQLLCKQIWLLVGKSVISTLDLSNTSPLWLSRFNNPSCHSSDCLRLLAVGVVCCKSFKILGGLYPKVVVQSEDMSDSRAGLHLLVKRPFLAFVSLWKISWLYNFGMFFLRSHIFRGIQTNRRKVLCHFYEATFKGQMFMKCFCVIQLCLLLLIYWLSHLAEILDTHLLGTAC